MQIYCDSLDAISRRFPRALALAAAAFLLFCPAASGLDKDRALTQYVHRIWQAQQGLPQATIYAIAQTSDGYLWLGTQTGLVRFDGIRFVPVRDTDGPTPDGAWIRDLVADSDRG
ncbi:MAG TPA: two-component regulator propeller domain-containing protein, partial [Tepidisphaeraceae bacterium]|nr:two-component regulator propeller domain-containing protein [Tepidisphaeraceae bacterium]